MKYLVFVLFVFLIFFLDQQVYAQTGVSPTFFCVGTNPQPPCVTRFPSQVTIALPTTTPSPIVPIQPLSSQSTLTPTLAPTALAPCINQTQTSVLATKRHPSIAGGFLQQFLQFLLQLLQLLFQFLGGQIQPPVATPSPSPIPTQNPCPIPSQLSTPTVFGTSSTPSTPLPSITPAFVSISNNFIKICGTQLCLNGKPYRIHGATAYGTYANPASEIALAKQSNINTLEIVEFETKYHNLADTMSAATWSRLDNFIAEAQKNGIHIILNFSSYGQSLQTAGLNPTGDWNSYLSFVANRVNTITGIKYANDPTILMVEFWGEIDAPSAGIHPDSTGTTANITAFYKRSSSEWKALDPNHIVSSGGFAYLNLKNSAGIDWQSIMSDPNNQVCDIEINSTGDRNTTVPMVTNYCKGINKPWFLSAWSSCYQAGGGDLTNEPDITHMTTHAQDMYFVANGGTPAAGTAIGSDFWNLRTASPNPGTCDLGPQFPMVWSVIQNSK